MNMYLPDIEDMAQMWQLHMHSGPSRTATCHRGAGGGVVTELGKRVGGVRGVAYHA